MVKAETSTRVDAAAVHIDERPEGTCERCGEVRRLNYCPVCNRHTCDECFYREHKPAEPFFMRKPKRRR